jgi:hypothetical protein
MADKADIKKDVPIKEVEEIMTGKDNGEWEEVVMSPIWEFDLKEKKEIAGVLVDVQEDVGKNHSMLYTIETKSGERWGVWGSTVIDVRMRTAEIGQEIKFEYLGNKKSPTSGREYKDFNIFKKKT